MVAPCASGAGRWTLWTLWGRRFRRERLVILLAGGVKKRQQEDILLAKANWDDYRSRKT
jgi:hypothetical protein